MANRELRLLPIGIGVAVVVIAVVAVVIYLGRALPDDVQPISWHKQPCAHCQMLISEPAHAAQLITSDGDVLSFDDPGCALQFLRERNPQVHRMWFHHHSEERWIPNDEVAFMHGGPTPMGFGLRAVAAGTPGAKTLAAAQAHVDSHVRREAH